MGIRTAALLILAYCTDGAEIRHHVVIRYDENMLHIQHLCYA